MLAVGTVNRLGLSLRAFGSKAFVVMPPEHLVITTSRGLRALTHRVGFEHVETYSVDIYLREWTLRLRPGRDNSAPTSAESRGSYLQTYGRLTGSALFSAAQAVANLGLRLTGLGDQLVMMARKPTA
jgi:hypothetical protein